MTLFRPILNKCSGPWQVWQNNGMAACLSCDGFSQRFNISDLREYQNIIRQLIEAVNQGTFLLVQASCPLPDMLSTPFPGDVISHEFQCFACGRAFQLSADTYHGHASWTIGDPPNPFEKLSKPN
jgi:hypothetical protein